MTSTHRDTRRTSGVIFALDCESKVATVVLKQGDRMPIPFDKIRNAGHRNIVAGASVHFSHNRFNEILAIHSYSAPKK